MAQPAPSSPRATQDAPARAQELITRSMKLTRLHTAAAPAAAHRGAPEVLLQSETFQRVFEWELNGRVTHTYSNLLRHLSLHEWNVGEPQLQPFYRTERTYDAQGRLIESRSDFIGPDGPEPSWRTLFTYTGSDLVATTVINQAAVGAEWQNEDRFSYVLAPGGAYFTAGQRDVWHDGQWSPDLRFTIASIEGGTMYTTEYFFNGSWVNDERATVPGYTQQQLFDTLNDVAMMEEDFGDLFLPASLIPDHVMQVWTGAAWEFDMRQVSETFYEFGTGLVERVEITFEEYVGGAWHPDGRFVKSYALDEDPHEDVFEMQYLDGEGWVTFLMESYEHGASGRLVFAEQAFVLEEDRPAASANEPEPFAYQRFTFTWGDATVDAEQPGSRLAFGIDAVYPNPVQTAAVVRLDLEQGAPVTLELFDLLGRRVAVLSDGLLPAGAHDLRLDAGGLPSGMYLLRLRTPEGQDVRLVTIAR